MYKITNWNVFIHTFGNEKLGKAIKIAKVLLESDGQTRYVYLEKDNYHLTTTKLRDKNIIGYIAKNHNGEILFYD